MTQTRFEQATALSEALIVTLGLQATMEATREQLEETPEDDRTEVIDTMMQTIATSMAALVGTAEA